MNMLHIIISLIIVLFFIFLAGRLVKKLPPNVVKTVNWISFIFATISGLLLFLKATILPATVFLFVFVFSLIVYFIFFNYEAKKEDEG